MNDKEAVRRIRRGDSSGLEALVMRYQVEAARVAYLITRDRQLADDVMQTAFVLAYERIEQYDPSRPFPPWFFRIVTNAALKALRHDRRALDADVDLAELLPDSSPGPEEALSAAEVARRVWEALGRLTPGQRAVVVMRYYLAYSEREIAAEVGRPLGTVRWRLHAARQRLRELLFADHAVRSEPVELEEEGRKP